MQDHSKTANSDYASTSVKINTENAPSTGTALDKDYENSSPNSKIALVTTSNNSGGGGFSGPGSVFNRNSNQYTGNTIATSRRARAGHTISVATRDGPGSGLQRASEARDVQRRAIRRDQQGE